MFCPLNFMSILFKKSVLTTEDKNYEYALQKSTG